MFISRTTHLILQFLLTILNIAATQLPPDFVPAAWHGFTFGLIHGTTGFLQLLLGNAAHNSNPNGTSALLPYSNGTGKGGDAATKEDIESAPAPGMTKTTITKVVEKPAGE